MNLGDPGEHTWTYAGSAPPTPGSGSDGMRYRFRYRYRATWMLVLALLDRMFNNG